MDLPAALEWYTHLARQPGWKAYVWQRVQDMAREYPKVFGDLPAMLTEAMRNEADQAPRPE